MKKFLLGDDLHCDTARLIDTRLLIQANSGGGKSWCLRRLLEQTHGQVQHIVIDPEGEFSTLREKFDYVLAAPHGADTQTHPRTAKLLAERLLELGVSAVLDIYELKAHERIAFVKGFLETIVDAPKKLWHPALIVVDEAHVYCPEKGDAESAGAVIDLMTRGRKRGFCGVPATQRLSKLRKDAAAECNNRLIGRTGLDVDVKRAMAELGFGKDRYQDLVRLDEGEFFAYGPAISRQVVQVKIGTVQTTHPKAGARIAFVAPPPTEKVRALLPKLADLPAEAEARQKTVDDLKKEISTLKRELHARPVTEKVETKIERVEVPALAAADQSALLAACDAARLAATRVEGLLGPVMAALKRVPMPHTKGISWNPDREVREYNRLQQSRPDRLKTQPPPVRNVIAGNGHLSGPEQRILDAIAWLESIGQREPLLTAVAYLAGYSIGGGAFNNPRGALRGKGYIEYRGDRLVLTEDGRALANAPEADLTADEMQRRVLDRLAGPEAKILKVLIDVYPAGLAKDELATLSGYSQGGGAFNNPCGRLRSLGLIEYRGVERYAMPVLFLEDER